MKQRVKAAGGKIDGDLRFSIQWNEDGKDDCDLDAHCKEVATNTEIYYGSYRGRKGISPCGGNLDVDIIHPGKDIAVENIVYADKTKMKPGQYAFSYISSVARLRVDSVLKSSLVEMSILTIIVTECELTNMFR